MARREIAEREGRRGSVNVGSGPWRRKRQWEIHSQAAFFIRITGQACSCALGSISVLISSLLP